VARCGVLGLVAMNCAGKSEVIDVPTNSVATVCEPGSS